MIEVIKSPTPVVEKTQWTAFLAGPMNGAPSWQAQAPKVAAKVGIENLTLLNPRKTDRFVSGTYQVNWETFGLRMCDVILFWIPPQAREMKPHRVYAITTVKKIHSTLEDVMLELKAWMGRPRKDEEKIHRMTGPAFEPMGKMSRMIQPSTCRNETKMEQWNQTIAPGDTVYVDGDFGAEEWKAFLNGTIIQGSSNMP